MDANWSGHCAGSHYLLWISGSILLLWVPQLFKELW